MQHNICTCSGCVWCVAAHLFFLQCLDSGMKLLLRKLLALKPLTDLRMYVHSTTHGITMDTEHAQQHMQKRDGVNYALLLQSLSSTLLPTCSQQLPQPPPLPQHQYVTTETSTISQPLSKPPSPLTTWCCSSLLMSCVSLSNCSFCSADSALSFSCAAARRS